MRVTLNRLHKYRQKLKEEITYGRLPELKRFFSVNLSDKIDNCINNVEKFDQEQKKKVERYESLSKDYSSINVLLFKANMDSKLNEVLNTLPMYNRLLDLYKKWKQCGPSDPENPRYEKSSMLSHKLGEIKGDLVVEVEVMNETVIQEKVVELTRLIRELEDRKDKINAEYTVELELSDYSKELIGLS